MRLIDVNTLEFEEFIGSEIPQYAILSHTWHGNTEVIFQEWERAATDASIRQKAGYAKIVGACRLARADGWQYLWCDTNCIDKTSSAELSEAINSMYAWYRDSQVCYAYLNDVRAGTSTDTLSKSRWFRRGWTLQELLAPSTVRFYDQDWTPIGTKMELASTISDITRIHIGALGDRSTIHKYSIAQRMSWAADRETTRPEDIAYCLLGIFGIHMPLLYGEGPKAFERLQREIIEVSADQSILAWDLQDSSEHPLTSALAPSPAEFRFCGSVVPAHDHDQKPYSTTNSGLSIILVLIRMLKSGMVLVGLNCAKELHRDCPHSRLPNGAKIHRHFRIWIPLCRLNDNTYARAHSPSSKVYLEESYPQLARQTLTDLLLCLDTHRAHLGRPLGSSPVMPGQGPLDTYAGVMVRVASGNISPRQIFREVYPLGDISIVQFGQRKASTVSNHLVSNGTFSVVLSVFWDSNGSPQEWLHTTILDSTLRPSGHMTSEVAWECLLGAGGNEQPLRSYNNVDAMRSCHMRLQKIHEASLSSYMKQERVPVICIEKEPLRDVFEHPELIVDVIFR
ncbi:HET-domain-containing protein [Hypomontagnella submonticulosa]|nr:HET-domain-containing protein [Hypomontagnella submonticulosa]